MTGLDTSPAEHRLEWDTPLFLMARAQYEQALPFADVSQMVAERLTYPERAATPLPPLDLSELTLEFSAPDTETFPLLALAREAGERGGTYPCVFNAANEAAVAAFLEGKLPFLEIAAVVTDALARADGAPARDIADLLEVDRAARAIPVA